LGIPPVQFPKLGGPVELAAVVIVIKDPDVAGSDCLTQALVIFAHRVLPV
jgi:hypothetical protein